MCVPYTVTPLVVVDMVSPVAIAEDNKRDALTNQLQRVADFISYLEN